MAEALRVLSVIPGGPEGSSMIFCRRLNSVLEQAGVDVRSFHLDTSRSVIGLLRELRRLRAVMSAFDPQILHAQYGTITAFCCALVANRPLVVTFRGSDLNPAPSLSRIEVGLKNAMSQYAAMRAEASICVSEELLSRLRFGRERARVIPTGVDTAVFFPRPWQDARRQVGWGAERVVLFYGGRHPRVKRLDLALAAMDIVMRELPDSRMENMDGTVEPGAVPVLMAAADCLLLTSDYEGSPTVVQEAKACDLPVVSVAAGDVSEQLAGIRHCHVVERDPPEIARALVEVLRRRERSDGARRVGSASLESVAQRTLEVYGEVLDRHRR